MFDHDRQTKIEIVFVEDLFQFLAANGTVDGAMQ
jgi:hypothetical protein